MTVSDRVTFQVTHTALAEASQDVVFKQIADIPNWNKWDVRIEYTKMTECGEGKTFQLKPTTGNEVTVTIAKLGKNHFEGVARLRFGEIHTQRHVQAVDRTHSIVTQTMRATVDSKVAEAFGRHFWPQWRDGIRDSTEALAKLASLQLLMNVHRNG